MRLRAIAYPGEATNQIFNFKFLIFKLANLHEFTSRPDLGVISKNAISETQ